MFSFLWKAIGLVLILVLIAGNFVLSLIGLGIAVVVVILIAAGAAIFGGSISRHQQEKEARQMQLMQEYNDRLIAHAQASRAAKAKPSPNAHIDSINQYIQDEMERVAQEQGKEGNFPVRPM